MNDLERDIRDTLLHHEDDAPPLDISDARRAAGRARRRQARNVVVGVIAGAAVIVALVAPGGLLRADRPPTVLDQPSPSPTSVATPGPPDAVIHGWPGRTRNEAGFYSWDSSPNPQFQHQTMGFMHNAYKPGSGAVNIVIDGAPGRLAPHRGQTAVTVAGYEGTYRQFIAEQDHPWKDEAKDQPIEEWMVDIEGTTVTILLIANPGAPEAEVAEAHEIIESIRVEPGGPGPGIRLIFTLTTNTWDSG